MTLKLERIRQRFLHNHRAGLTFSPAVVEAIAARSTDSDSGARSIDHILAGTLMPELAAYVLDRMAANDPVEHLDVDLGTGGNFIYRSPSADESALAV
ncbi:hypothetical protein KBTX_04283 [wastewater metagenome]|uniref:Clp ATPase C-terminal domain-containing protein n=2 Tax=unclassified sequences TaxID=12908 RepID=A0A5B8RLI8_9ZZZZ|nr:hypothetical protein KBTEX_04283 [uncultured organism]